MKDSISNNIGAKLIQKKNFSIIDTSSLPASIIKYSLYKEIWGANHFVNFSDADIMKLDFFDAIKENMAREVSAFKNAGGAAPVIYFKVFITKLGLPDEKTENILRCYDHSVPGRSTFIPIVLDLSSSRVCNPAPGMDKIGLTALLKESMSENVNLAGFGYLEEIYKAPEKVTENTHNKRNAAHIKPYVTYSIIAVNILMFLITYLMEKSGNPYALYTMGAKINELIISGEYWRLLSSAFLHAGIAHIALNMLGVYNSGWLVEKLYGSKKYIFIYLSSALMGSVFSFAFSKAPSVGASGALFGLFGTLLFTWRRKRRMFSASFGVSLILVLLFNIIYGFSNSGIDNFAHIGGFIGGCISSSAIGLWDDKGKGLFTKKALLYIALAGIFLLLLIYGILTNNL